MLDDPTISSVVFYPRKTTLPSQLPSHILPLQFQISDEVLIGGFCFLKDRGVPTILMFHGNGEVAQDYFQLADLFLQIGVNLAVIDYRGYGFSSGTPFYSSLFTDALPIFNCFISWAQDLYLSDSFFVMGRSLGSVCASEIGASNPAELKGIIFESSFASVYNLMTHLFGIDETIITPDVVRPLSNDIRMSKIQQPVLIIHGTNDRIIPFSEGQLIKQAISKKVETLLVPIEGGGHNDLFLYPKQYFPPLKEFVEKHK